MKNAEVARAALDAYRRRAEAAEALARDLDRENTALKHALAFLVRSLEPDADEGPGASRMVS